MKSRKTIFIIYFFTLFLYCLFCDQEAGKLSGEIKTIRPVKWAEPMELQGLPNFYKVTDNLYRGAQPEKIGIEELKKLGIKTIINLRLSNTDYEIIAGSGFKYYFLPVNTLSPDRDKFARFIEIISDPANCPVFVHCRRGADRTGTAVALFRIKVQKWPVEEAVKEMQNGGYHFNSIYFNLKSLVRNF